jgi:soluble lytic murein transglycosylase-like protein
MSHREPFHSSAEGEAIWHQIASSPAEPWKVLAMTVAVAMLFATSSAAQIYTRRNTNGVIEATNVPTELDFRLTYAGKGTLIHSLSFRHVYTGQYDRHIEDAAMANGISSDLIRAIIAVESEFDAYAVSSKGAQGLMQLMPFTARRFGVNNSFDPRQNIFGGAQYLRFLLDMFAGDVTLAAAAYNAGENAVLRFKGVPPFRETQGYVRKVRNLLGNGVPTSYVIPAAGSASPTAAPMRSYAPSGVMGPAAAPRRASVSLAPVRARTYYKFRDEKGVLHVAHTAPAEGVLYTTIRAFD